MKDLRKYWMWLSHRAGAGSKTAVNLIRKFGDPLTIYKCSIKELEKCGEIRDKRIIARLSNKDLREEESILSWCDSYGVRVLVPTDPDYPGTLLALQDAPMVLYMLGKMPDLDNTFCCAVVGTREMSEYGKECAYNIGVGLARGGACVVSGLALGVDGMAMAGAIEAGGKTIAVLGCGIDVVYPKQHEKLLRSVIETGAVITEYAPGVSPAGHNFPVRNRLISGISQAVCVVEGKLSSGAVITARHAVYQGKNLYAVPGRIGEKGSEGTNFLLRDGAVAVTCVNDIFADFEFIYPFSVDKEGPMIIPTSDEAGANLGIGSRGVKVGSRKGAEGDKPKKEKRIARKKECPFPEKEEKPKEKAAARVDVESLGENEIRILEYMKPDVPMLCEEIAEGGFELSDVMVALTLLEIAGAVEAGAGGYYLKRAADYGGDPEYITEDDDGL